ncbi:MAG: hypothetical protein IIY93_02855 [Clostridia bacterium]|nr:hypothetical protein [Clostridia bacterium]MBQ1412113.1 hypothetical protein [Clostridia bacterium]MBQ1555397.1 hypothetical protein [Clostridia bacterium]MBQ5545126.1 hypothetical protein [Clostridia bacterium]
MDDKKAMRTLTLGLVEVPLAVLILMALSVFSLRSTFQSVVKSNTTVAATVDSAVKSGFQYPGTDTLTVDYTVDGKEYTTFVLTKSGTLQEGDTLTLLYDAKKPAEASTQEHYDAVMKTYKVYLVILAVIAGLCLIGWFVLVPLPEMMERRNRKQYGTYTVSKTNKEVMTPYGTIRRNPNHRK